MKAKANERAYRDAEEMARTAAQEDPQGDIRIRIQPQVYLKSYGKAGGYLAWKGITWGLICESVAEAMAVKRLMDDFFTRLTEEGPVGMQKVLDTGEKLSVESRSSTEP